MGRVAFGVGICLALWVPSCTFNDSGSKDGEEGGGVNPPDPGWTLAGVDVSDCNGAVPSARYAAATAFFSSSLLLDFGGRPVHRGFVLAGGRTSSETTSDRLSDLWLYDTAAVEDCPWIELSADAFGLPAGDGISDGNLVYDDSSSHFVYTGGFVGDANGSASSDRIYRLIVSDLDEFQPVFVHDDDIPLFTAFTHDQSDPTCQSGSMSGYCFNSLTCDLSNPRPIDPCTGVDLTGVTDCCAGAVCVDGSIGDPGTPNFICSGDPACTHPASLEATVDGGMHRSAPLVLPGHADAAAVQTGDSIRIFGGTTGCHGLPECSSLVSLQSYNVDRTVDLSYTGGLFGWSTDPWPVGETFGVGPGWPEGASLAPRGWAAAPLGRSWSHTAHSFVVDPADVLLVGGTLAQDQAPYWSYGVEDGLVVDSNTGTCTADLPIDGQWTPSTVEQLILLDDFAAMHRTPLLTGHVGFTPVTSALPRLVDPAVAVMGPYGVLVVGGGSLGVDGQVTSPVDEVYLVDMTTQAPGLTVATTLPRGVQSGVVEVDPLTNVAYIVDNQGEVFRLTHADTEVVDGVGATLTQPTYTLDYDVALDNGSFQGAAIDVEVVISVEHVCARSETAAPPPTWMGDQSEACFTEEVNLVLRDVGDEQSPTLPALVEGHPDALEVIRWGYPAQVRFDRVTRVQGTTSDGTEVNVYTVPVRLPFPMADGELTVLQASLGLTPNHTITPEIPYRPPQGVPFAFELPASPSDQTCLEIGEDGSFERMVIRSSPVELAGKTDVIGTGFPPGAVTLQPYALHTDAKSEQLAVIRGVMGRVDAANPDDWLMMSGGAYDDCQDISSDVLAGWLESPSNGHCVVIHRPMELHRLTTVFAERAFITPSFDPRFTVVVDDCLVPMAKADLIEYTDAGELANDLAFLEDRLGSLPNHHGMVYYGRPAHSAFAGLFQNGLYAIEHFTPGGDYLGTSPEVVRNVTVHELAHSWFGYGADYEEGEEYYWDIELHPSARWFEEAMPSILGEMRYPTQSAPKLHRGVRYWAETVAAATEPPTVFANLESHFVTSPDAYAVSAYVAAQLYHAIPMEDPTVTTDEQVWDRIATTLTDPYLNGVQRRVEPDDLAQWMEDVGLPDFYDQWVASVDDPWNTGSALVRAVPQIGWSTAVEDAASHTVTFTVGDRGGLGDYGPVESPFLVACDGQLYTNPPGVADFTPTGCDGDLVQLGALSVRSSLSDSAVVLTYPGNGDPVPFDIALWSGADLLPENVGQTPGLFGHAAFDGDPYPPAPSWKLYCTDYTDPSCPAVQVQYDADGDGFPDVADCQVPPSIPTDESQVYFLAPFDTGLTVDRNCDGWPLPSVLEILP